MPPTQLTGHQLAALENTGACPEPPGQGWDLLLSWGTDWTDEPLPGYQRPCGLRAGATPRVPSTWSSNLGANRRAGKPRGVRGGQGAEPSAPKLCGGAERQGVGGRLHDPGAA